MVAISKEMVRSVLTNDLCNLIDTLNEIDDIEHPRRFNNALRRVKAEFARCRIDNMDFSGFCDLYAESKRVE